MEMKDKNFTADNGIKETSNFLLEIGRISNNSNTNVKKASIKDMTHKITKIVHINKRIIMEL